MMLLAAEPAIDPVVTAVIANRIDGIVREMTNTLLRAARSAVISSARDFSCGICTADNQLLACVEGLPIHIFGVHEQARAMTTAHPRDFTSFRSSRTPGKSCTIGACAHGCDPQITACKLGLGTLL